MKLRTQIEITPLRERIQYADRIFTIGSCFAQNIGARVARAKFRTTINPTGTLFNPLSICDTITRLCDRRRVDVDELREGAGGWYHYDMHSSLNESSPQQAAATINLAIDRGGAALESAQWVVITLGTAWVYERIDTGEVVANCHKEPARNFRRRQATLEEIVERLDQTIGRHLSDKRIILTLSPIRHVSDGLEQNSLSKATLRIAIDQVVARDPQRRFYLPAYEILVDDLRDYRFYADDMVHPSSVAMEYVWQYFCDVALGERAKCLLPRVMKIVAASQHRPTNPEGEPHKALCRAQLRAIEELKEVDMSEESQHFYAQLKINL
ncbi:MAG: GSCFA domain-containing protein [Rikenellaceae bacterium]